jgi:hypothetical protein
MTSRRTVLAGTAALPALSLPVIAAEPDPVFAAIANWKRAYDYLGECLEKKRAIDEVIFEKRREMEGILEANKSEVTNEAMRITGGKYTPEEAYDIMAMISRKKIEKENGDAEGDAWERRGHGAIDKAEDALFETRPTTRAGLIALISLVIECPDPSWFIDHQSLGRVLETTREALRIGTV